MENHRRNIRSRALFTLLVFFVCAQFACTKKEDPAQIRIVMPVATGASKVAEASVTSQGISASGTDQPFNSAINPTAGNQINCFAVFIGGGDLAGNSCGVGASSAQTTSLRFGPNVGFVYAGKEVAIETPPGDRVIHVVGIYAATATACSSYANGAALDKTNLSEPFLIASQPAKIPSGPSTVAIAPVFDSTKKLFNCSFAGSGGNNPTAAPFGDKRDGSLTSTGAPVMTASASTLAAGGVRSGDPTLSSSKIFGASRRITSIATSGETEGRLLTIGSFNTTQFDVGDEVAWYVAGGATSVTAGGAPVGPDDTINGACGGGLYLGRYGVARVTAVQTANQQIVVDRAIGAPATLKVANLSRPPSSSDYCTIVLTRVSSFDSISVPDNYSLTINAEPFNYASGTGGFLMIRADTIQIGTFASMTIDGSAKGFVGGSTPAGSPTKGDGLNQIGMNGTGSNANGGAIGSGAIGGGGGGQAGPGGHGTGATALLGGAGSAIAACSGPCLPFRDEKAFFGGGGGAAGSSAVGGNGGAVVIIFARTISGTGALNIYAKGAVGAVAGVGAGGGAGGAIGLFTKSSTISSLSLLAKGGNGGATTANGGGGGGGAIQILKCIMSGTLLTDITGGLSGAEAGGNGVLANDLKAELCLL